MPWDTILYVLGVIFIVLGLLMLYGRSKVKAAERRVGTR